MKNLRIVLSLLTLVTGLLSARNKRVEPPQDQIRVLAHLPLTSGTVTRFLETSHYRRDYLYAENESGKGVTLIDVTAADRPSVLANLAMPNDSGNALVAVTGNAAIVASNGSALPSTTPQTFTIMSFADPLHPSVQQQFNGVTAMAHDDQRGLIFLANADGLWILRQSYAVDPAAEKEWEHMMLDNR